MCMVQSHMYIEDISYDYGVQHKHMHSIKYTHCIAYMHMYYMYAGMCPQWWQWLVPTTTQKK